MVSAYLASCLVIVFLVRTSHGEVVKFGQLVTQNGSWEQNGVVLLLHQVHFSGTLFRIRAGFRNTNPIYVQAWRWLQIINDSYEFQLTGQRKYSSRATGVESVNLSEGGIRITNGEYIGVFFPEGILSALVFQEVQPGYELKGSNFLHGVHELTLGEKILFRSLGYINKFSIEFYVQSDIQTTTTTTTIATSTTTRATSTSLSPVSTSPIPTTSVKESSLVPEDTSLITGRWTTTDLEKSSLINDKVTGEDYRRGSRITVVTSAVAVVCLLAFFALVLGCLLAWRKRRQSGSGTRYIETPNPLYGTGFEHGRQDPNEESTATGSVNIYDTINSGIFNEIHEAAIKNTP